MKLFRKRRKGNNKGLSLVELVCAVAILGIVLTAIGSAMVVSAQSYGKGTYEIDVQREAQTTTNLVGNLIVDAVTAEFTTPSENQKILKVNNGKTTYEITFDKAAGVLNYREQDIATGAEAFGVLAQNVKDFDVNLNDFAAHNNAEVYLKVEKTNREYEATYNTTSRNGSSESTGVADVASIIVENNVVLEPGQTYQFPITVVGSASNRAVSVSGLSTRAGELADTTFSYDSFNNVATVTIGINASGSFAFNVATIMTDDAGLPLASAQVVIDVRRVNAITTPNDVDGDNLADATALKSGIAYKSGAVYRVEFTPVGENFEKRFGKAFDMDYIDPRQLDLSITMSAPYNVNDYVRELSKIYTATDSSNAYAEIQLLQDLPEGAEIHVKATSKHARGTNKTLRAYATVERDVIIKKMFTPFSMTNDINRGNDDHGVEILFNEEYHAQLVALYGSNYRRSITVYEAKVDETGALVRDGYAFTVDAGEQGGLRCAIRGEDSKRLRPDKAYIINCSITFYNNDGSVKWPVAGTDPALYSTEFPVPALSVVYDCGASNMGLPGNEYPLSKNNMIRMKYKCNGLDLTRFQNNITWTVEKSDGFGNFSPYTGSTEIASEMSSEEESIRGIGQMKIKFTETGTYRLKANITNYSYKDYAGNNITGNFTLNDGAYVGVLYVKVQ